MVKPRDVSKVPEDPSAFDLLDPERQEHVLCWINEYLTPIKGFNLKHTSYGLKHKYDSFYENEDRYLTNSEFKGAMLKAGYKVKNKEDLNWFFNISEKSLAFKH